MEVTRFRGRIQSVEKALAMAVIRRQPKQVSTTRTRERSKLWPPSGNDAGRRVCGRRLRRIFVRGLANLLIQLCGFNLRLQMGHLTRVGTPRSLQHRALARSGMLFEAGMGLSMAWNRFWERLWKSIHPNRCIELHGPIISSPWQNPDFSGLCSFRTLALRWPNDGFQERKTANRAGSTPRNAPKGDSRLSSAPLGPK